MSDVAVCRCGRLLEDGRFCPGCGFAPEGCDCASEGAAQVPVDPFTPEEVAEILGEFFGTDKPLLRADDPDLEAISSEAWAVLRTSNIEPVRIFRMGGLPTRLEADDDGAPIIKALTVERLRQEMGSCATWYKAKGQFFKVLAELVDPSDPESEAKAGRNVNRVRPPRDVMQNMLAQPDIFLPILERIVEAPVYGPEGTIETQPGYHAGSRTYYAGRRLSLESVSADPTHMDVDRAVGILDELLRDFPFVSDGDGLTAIAAMLGPFVRALIDGSTPLHLIEAPTPGTGKGLLADVIAIPSTGRRAATITEARGEEEWRKRITAMVRNGRAITLLDNVQARLESPALSAALTSPLWTDRLLGSNEIVAYPVRTTWLATGNNVALSREIARRTVRCRMDAGVDHPESRAGFLHQLPEWAHEHRAEIVWSCLTLAQNWIAAGRPPWSGVPLGSLEAWCKTMGGIFEAARMKGFLDNLEDFRESSDEESATWTAFMQRWDAAFGGREVTQAELFELARDVLDLGTGTTRAQQTHLGNLLSQQRDRWYGKHRIERRGLTQGRRRWALTDRTDGG